MMSIYNYFCLYQFPYSTIQQTAEQPNDNKIACCVIQQVLKILAAHDHNLP